MRFNFVNLYLKKLLTNTTNGRGVIKTYTLSTNRHMSLDSYSIGIIGAPFAKGQRRDGTDLGPKVVREHGLIKHLQHMGHTVVDFGDLVFEENELDKKEKHGRLNNPHTVGDACEKLAQKVSQVAEENYIPFTIGGDHSIAIGTINGNSRVNKNLFVIWIDAHVDLNTHKSSQSGNFHGMSGSFVIRDFVDKLNNPNSDCPGMSWTQPNISAENFAYIGLRDLDTSEIDHMTRLNMTNYSMRDIDKLGIQEVIHRILDKVNHSKCSIHVSFDVDSIDEYILPSTGTPVPGGLNLREAFYIGEEIAKTKLLKGFDLVEINPLIGNENHVKRSVNCAVNVALTFFGKKRIELYARVPGNEHYQISD